MNTNQEYITPYQRWRAEMSKINYNGGASNYGLPKGPILISSISYNSGTTFNVFFPLIYDPTITYTIHMDSPANPAIGTGLGTPVVADVGASLGLHDFFVIATNAFGSYTSPAYNFLIGYPPTVPAVITGIVQLVGTLWDVSFTAPVDPTITYTVHLDSPTNPAIGTGLASPVSADVGAATGLHDFYVKSTNAWGYVTSAPFNFNIIYGTSSAVRYDDANIVSLGTLNVPTNTQIGLYQDLVNYIICTVCTVDLKAYVGNWIIVQTYTFGGSFKNTIGCGFAETNEFRQNPVDEVPSRNLCIVYMDGSVAGLLSGTLTGSPTAINTGDIVRYLRSGNTISVTVNDVPQYSIDISTWSNVYYTFCRGNSAIGHIVNFLTLIV